MVLVLDITAIFMTLINFIEVKRTTTGKPPSLWIVPVLLIVTVFIPIAIILLCIFALYRESIRIILKIKYGERFGGLLNGPDAFQTTGETVQHVINGIVVYQCPKDVSAQEFYKILDKKLRKPYSEHPKFNVTFKKEFGYSYMLKQKSNFDTSFRKMRLVNSENYKLSKTELMQLVNEYANLDLPKGNRIPWELLIGSQPIQWKDDKYNYYFSLGRYHHAIGDGATFTKLMVAAYADKEETTRKTSKYFFKQNQSVIIKLFKMFVENFLALILIPSHYVSTAILKGRDKNILKGKELSQQCHYAINVEDHSGYVQKIKRIKSKIPGVSFPDVLLTAISASLNDFFTKNSQFIDKISVVLPVLADSTKLLNLKQIEVEDVQVQNDFSSLILDLPICISNKPDQSDIIHRLKLISKETKALRTSFHYSIHRLITKTLWAYLPQPLLAYTPKLASYSGILSLLPGMPKITSCNGLVTISNFIPWNPHAFDIGTTILINTYNDHLHIAVSIDKAIVENHDDVQEIADNIFKYLDLLEKETLKYCAM